METNNEEALNNRLYYRFTVFLEVVNVNHLSRSLRRLLLAYLRYELNTGVDLYFPELLVDLSNLFELLDDIEAAYLSPQEEKEN